MHFRSIAVFTFTLTGIANATCPPRVSDGDQAGSEVADFVKDAVNNFFPYKDGWETAYDAAFSTDLKASFNATSYTFDTFKQLYSAIYGSLTKTYQGTFDHGFLTVVGVPNANDIGGFVTLTGWEGGGIMPCTPHRFTSLEVLGGPTSRNYVMLDSNMPTPYMGIRD
ncbi:hypothetical protein K449DRAFT_403918 [Hypoxylon sp. EC38]|nr:hypothetical protein K449DRAFT_403918 [Hypoxylon sp. EC38]